MAALADPAAGPVTLTKKTGGPKPADDVALGRRLIAKGDYKGALAAADRAIAAHPDRAPGYFLKGRVLILDGAYAEAQAPILDAVARDRGNALYLDALGAVNARLGDPGRALAAYRMAIAANPADGFAYYNTGVIHYAAGDLSGAAYDFYGAGLAYLKSGDFGRAEKALADLKTLSNRGLQLAPQIATIDHALKALSGRKT
jgi:tetratricopeptide (TPR) repeat protein